MDRRVRFQWRTQYADSALSMLYYRAILYGLALQVVHNFRIIIQDASLQSGRLDSAARESNG